MELSPIRMQFDLQISQLRLERQIRESHATLRQARYSLREAKAAQLEYRGSLKHFRDKLTGKQEATETALRHAVEKAEAALASAQQEKEALETRLAELKSNPAALPDWESLRDGSTLWYRLEALYCAEALIPLLEETRQALLERRKMTTGANPGKIYTYPEQAEISSAPESAAARCGIWTDRLTCALEALELPIPSQSFFEDPSYFLNSATQYTRLNRLNDAIGQTEALQRLLPDLQNQLKE